MSSMVNGSRKWGDWGRHDDLGAPRGGLHDLCQHLKRQWMEAELGFIEQDRRRRIGLQQGGGKTKKAQAAVREVMGLHRVVGSAGPPRQPDFLPRPEGLHAQPEVVEPGGNQLEKRSPRFPDSCPDDRCGVSGGRERGCCRRCVTARCPRQAADSACRPSDWCRGTGTPERSGWRPGRACRNPPRHRRLRPPQRGARAPVGTVTQFPPAPVHEARAFAAEVARFVAEQDPFRDRRLETEAVAARPEPKRAVDLGSRLPTPEQEVADAAVGTDVGFQPVLHQGPKQPKEGDQIALPGPVGAHEDIQTA